MNAKKAKPLRKPLCNVNLVAEAAPKPATAKAGGKQPVKKWEGLQKHALPPPAPPCPPRGSLLHRGPEGGKITRSKIAGRSPVPNQAHGVASTVSQLLAGKVTGRIGVQHTAPNDQSVAPPPPPPPCPPAGSLLRRAAPGLPEQKALPPKEGAQEGHVAGKFPAFPPAGQLRCMPHQPQASCKAVPGGQSSLIEELAARLASRSIRGNSSAEDVQDEACGHLPYAEASDALLDVGTITVREGACSGHAGGHDLMELHEEMLRHTLSPISQCEGVFALTTRRCLQHGTEANAWQLPKMRLLFYTFVPAIRLQQCPCRSNKRSTEAPWRQQAR